MQISTDAPDLRAAEIVHHLLQAASLLNQNPLGRLQTRDEVAAAEKHAQALRDAPATTCWLRQDVALWFSEAGLSARLRESEEETVQQALTRGAWVKAPASVTTADHACDFALRPDEVRALLVDPATPSSS